ncbi:hypothetical protein HanRHA438_Chr17g0802551 [Helianthus annuus]|nr:hypothetical protein HanRHA438_Chr17g0802551 [Helianthus annuus]
MNSDGWRQWECENYHRWNGKNESGRKGGGVSVAELAQKVRGILIFLGSGVSFI